jgi:hypothetical protein
MDSAVGVEHVYDASTMPDAVVPGDDYAGAWHGTRGRCCRFVYDQDGKPTESTEPVFASGWRQDWQCLWHAVDACKRHSSELVSRSRAKG